MRPPGKLSRAIAARGLSFSHLRRVRWVQRRRVHAAQLDFALSQFGLTESAGEREIKRRYHRLAAKHHPDVKGGSKEEWKALQDNYEILQRWRGFGPAMNFGGLPELTPQQLKQMDCDLEDVINRKDKQKMEELTLRCVMLGYAGSTRTLFLLIDGAPLLDEWGPGHAKRCIAVIEAWERFNGGAKPPVDAFNSAMYPYAFWKGRNDVEDGERVFKSITLLCEAMLERDINPELEFHTKRLMDKAMKGSGKFSAPEVFAENEVVSWTRDKTDMSMGASSRTK